MIAVRVILIFLQVALILGILRVLLEQWRCNQNPTCEMPVWYPGSVQRFLSLLFYATVSGFGSLDKIQNNAPLTWRVWMAFPAVILGIWGVAEFRKAQKSRRVYIR